MRCTLWIRTASIARLEVASCTERSVSVDRSRLKDLQRVEMAANEEKESALNSLADDMVKLVAYTIVSLKRGAERVMKGGEGTVIVTDNMTGKAFVSWILAKYLQEEVNVPGPLPVKKARADILSPGELKYLRVYYVVS